MSEKNVSCIFHISPESTNVYSLWYKELTNTSFQTTQGTITPPLPPPTPTIKIRTTTMMTAPATNTTKSENTETVKTTEALAQNLRTPPMLAFLMVTATTEVTIPDRTIRVHNPGKLAALG